CAPGTYGMNCQQNCSDNCFNRTCNSVTGECDSGCNGYSNPPECTTPLNEHESSSMTFEAGIGVGIAVGAGVIVIILVVVLLIYRYYSATSNTRQERAPNQGTQPRGQNIKHNEETQIKHQGRELANYNELRQTKEYQHAYEETNISDTDTGYDESDSSSKCNSQDSTYDTIDKY
ncbi:platelet endothelial aggregation receptor 1, partial [Biomphalaria pfeifferi]